MKEPFSIITMQPQENPCRVLLGLHSNSTQGLFLKNLYCLQCTSMLEYRWPNFPNNIILMEGVRVKLKCELLHKMTFLMINYLILKVINIESLLRNLKYPHYQVTFLFTW